MNDIEIHEYYSDRYEQLACFLLYIQTGKGVGDINELETIKRYINIPTFSEIKLKKTIYQGEEILKLKPFPYKWIKHCINKSLDDFKGEEIEKYYKWFSWVIEELKREAKY